MTLYAERTVDGQIVLRAATPADVKAWLWENYRSIPLSQAQLTNIKDLGQYCKDAITAAEAGQ